MKKTKSIKLLCALFISLFTVVISTGCSCTKSLCTTEDEANIKQGIQKTNYLKWREDFLKEKGGVNGEKSENEVFITWSNNKAKTLCEGACDENEVRSILERKIDVEYSKEKVSVLEDWIYNIEILNNKYDYTGETTKSSSFDAYYNNKVETAYKDHAKACLVLEDDIDPTTGAKISKKTWKDAWSKGLLEGLIVFPISALLSWLTNAFEGAGNGISQFLAIFIATLIIRVLMLAINFKGQLGNMKMQAIQPEIQKISAVINDPNVTQEEKNKASMKMMEIYKKNNINPLSSLLSQFIMFPIFLAVWAAMQQTLVIREGEFLGMELGGIVSDQIFSGSITTIIIFVFMIVGQIVTIKLPEIIKKIKDKNKPTYKKDTKNAMQKQMNMMMYFMIIMVVMSGFLLPCALLLYWTFGMIFSVIQTIVFRLPVVENKLNELANRKKKAKVVR